jgi:hypothetical protein
VKNPENDPAWSRFLKIRFTDDPVRWSGVFRIESRDAVMQRCRSLLAEIEPNGRTLEALFDGFEGPRMQRLMRFARLGLVEIDERDEIHLTDTGRLVLASLSGLDTATYADEAEELNAFERAVGRVIGHPLARLQRNAA